MKILYRLSDSGNLKNKLPFADKFFCLANFVHVFKNEQIILIADNCKPETIEKLKSFPVTIMETSLGNAKSWRYAVEYAINTFGKDELVYFVEDDYIHLPDSPKLIEEGLSIGDYVTLYDHPDKYWNPGDGGNPFVKDGGEPTRVFLTPSSHWKLTNSTTMTFAARVSTLIEDRPIWWKHTQKWPNDFEAFKELCGRGSLYNYFFGKRKKLISPLPGFSTHVETKFLTPLIDWDRFKTS
jgi:hypothetical protein